MTGMFVFLVLYFLFFIFLIYVFICGNTKSHRNDCVGSLYYSLTQRLPLCLQGCCMFFIPPKYRKKVQALESSTLVNSLVAIFFVGIYLYFSFVYIKNCLPHANEYIGDVEKHKKIIYYILPLPWIFALLVKFTNPGVINKYNVDEYLKIYPHDHVIYVEKMCPTDHIPVVPRSRYDTYTKRRIA